MKQKILSRSVVVSRKAFTLIELLVVIAIIAVLMAVIAPTLKAAKERTKRLLCMSNLKQIGTATISYASSNHNRMIPGDMWNGLTIFHPMPWSQSGNGSPVNLGHLLDDNYLPLPQSQRSVIYCPSNRIEFGCYSTQGPGIIRDFVHNWKVPASAGGSTMVDVNYEFRDSMDGIHHAWIANNYERGKGVDTSRFSGKYPFVSDLPTMGGGQGFHEGVMNIVMADTSIYNIKFTTGQGKLISDALWNLIAAGTYYDDSKYFMYLDDYFAGERFVPIDADFWAAYGGPTRFYPNIKNDPLLW